MVDIKVKQVQEWLISTYSDRSEFALFVKDYDFKATGNTGNTTMVALVMALQYELGITGPSGSFGPTTIRLAPKISLANASTFSSNIIKILEGGLWCHGYSAGYEEPLVGEGVDFGGIYDEDTDVTVKKLQADIGISQSGKFDGYLWKALLSTDAFVTTWTNGSPNIREAQQYLNSLAINGYYFADDFIGSYLPTDGLNNRAFSKALILYIQANQGIYASEATGNLGPATQRGLVTIPDNLPNNSTKSRHFVRAVVFALLANGYDIAINSYWTQKTSNVVKQFQRDMYLPVTGKVDFSTWMSLLISYGDKNRPYKGCDTRFEITKNRLDKLKSMGIKTIGRYINGTNFKILREKEVKLIIDSGMKLIPIYQESATSVNDFSFKIGTTQAKKAITQLEHFGIPYNSVVYFAVDYDALGHEIDTNITPYFKGVKQELIGYRVGVYGTRNVCLRMNENGLATSSYVSNMSSGYSGNLGFKMPKNWAYDQFDEINIDDWAIDKVSVSDKAEGVTHLIPSITLPEEPKVSDQKYTYKLPDINLDAKTIEMDVVINMIIEMEHFYLEINPKASPIEILKNCLNALRERKYNSSVWDTFLDIFNHDFYRKIAENKPSLFKKIYDYSGNEYHVVDKHEGVNATIDLGHLSATLLGYLVTKFKKSWTGWVGDFCSAYDGIKKLNNEGLELQKASDKVIGASESHFNYGDFIVDIDAVQLLNRIPLFEELAGNHILSEVFKAYYQLTNKKFRYNYFIDVMVNSKSHSFNDVYAAITNTLYDDKVAFALILLSKDLSPSVEIVEAMIASTTNYVIQRSLID